VINITARWAFLLLEEIKGEVGGTELNSGGEVEILLVTMV
jgi:hypothetical protein